jgi:hypothetical protein
MRGIGIRKPLAEKSRNEKPESIKLHFWWDKMV